MMDIADHVAVRYERIIEEKDAEIARLQAVIADLRDDRDGRGVYELRLEDRVRDMQAVVDAARPHRHCFGGGALDDALRALDGEVKPLPTEINTKGSEP